MKVSVHTVAAKRTTGDCLVVGVAEGRRLDDTAAALDRAADKFLSRALRRVDYAGRIGTTLTLHEVPGLAAKSVMAVGLGALEDLTPSAYRRVMENCAAALASNGARTATLLLSAVPVEDRDLYWKVRQAVEMVRAKLYRCDRLKSSAEDRPPARLRALAVVVASRADLSPVKQAVRDAMAVADGMDLARELGDLPANICTPGHLAGQARKLARNNPALHAEIRGEADIKALKMGALLAVSQGSREPARLITLRYEGAPKGAAPIVLVGKGVTFDSGGISIKPSASMDEMKYDMCGAAAVLGTLRAVATLGLRLNLLGIIPATENLPGGNATRPGDIVRTLSGLSVEILNTDAEGRLILCDALTYAQRYKPAEVIDVATLTGACVVALGAHASGLFSNDEALAGALLAAGEYSGDRAWRLPAWDEYKDQLKSNFADLANVGGRQAGAITAACFLGRFAKKYRWAHLDIAGTAWRSGRHKGATGRPVALLTQYLLDRARHA